MIATGDLLNQEIEKDSQRGQKIQEIMREGKDAPADEIVPMAKEKMTNQPSALGFLIVGFPRDKRQAAMFNKEVKRPSVVLHLQVRRRVLAERAKNGVRVGEEEDEEESKKSNVLSKRINSYADTIPGVIEANKKVTKEIDAERKSKEELFAAATEEIDKLTNKTKESKKITSPILVFYLSREQRIYIQDSKVEDERTNERRKRGLRIEFVHRPDIHHRRLFSQFSSSSSDTRMSSVYGRAEIRGTLRRIDEEWCFLVNLLSHQTRTTGRVRIISTTNPIVWKMLYTGEEVKELSAGDRSVEMIELGISPNCVPVVSSPELRTPFPLKFIRTYCPP
ncbi:hypothetical protein KPH14_003423 [Odynerus spinipes]|uniref:Uncharacterized protein n=1 Tax=Odynerus spinipes TaxID=1348599 RepID=A0AAD9RCL6_9HYME|nr:hypothetical protein KPH14_003423 [Odynerus spinipes]